ARAPGREEGHARLLARAPPRAHEGADIAAVAVERDQEGERGAGVAGGHAGDAPRAGPVFEDDGLAGGGGPGGRRPEEGHGGGESLERPVPSAAHGKGLSHGRRWV